MPRGYLTQVRAEVAPTLLLNVPARPGRQTSRPCPRGVREVGAALARNAGAIEILVVRAGRTGLAAVVDAD